MSHAFTPKAIGKLEEGIRTRAAASDRSAARGGRRRLDRRRRRCAADVGHRRHHRHPRRGPAGDLRHPRPHPEGRIAGRSSSPQQDAARAVRQDLHLRARAHRGEAAQPHRRHLEHADLRGRHRRERRAAVHTRQRTGDLLLRDRLRGQRHHQERAGLGAAGVRRQSRRRSSGTAPTRRSGQRGRRGAALVDARRVLDAQHEGRRGDGRRHHPEGRSGGVDAAVGQPRRRGLRRPVRVRHRPCRQPACHVRRRRSAPLPGRDAGPCRDPRRARRIAAAAPTTSASARPRSPTPT